MKIKFNSDKLIDNYSNMIYRIALGYVDNTFDAEDIAQEVYLKYMDFVEENGKFKDDEHERYWIIRVTINLCRNELKSARQKYTVPLKEESIICYDIDTEKDLADSIKKLKEKYRIVFELFYLEDLKISEISNLLHISEANVKTRLKRARDIVKKDLRIGGEYIEKF